MKKYDGHDIKCLLGKRGYRPIDVARDLGVNPASVHDVIWGEHASKRIRAHIERLLGMKPGELRISRTQRESAAKVA